MRKTSILTNIKGRVIGRDSYNNFFSKFLIFALMIGIGYVYLYPIMFMVSYSLMDIDDIISPIVRWVPTRLYLRNYVVAWRVLDAQKAFFTSIMMSAIPAILQTISSAFIGYGFARFEFPLKKLWMVLLVSTFVILGQVTLIPKYILFNELGIINTPLAAFLPAMFGQGLKGAIFILIFQQFFKMIPKTLDEAAELDGAGKFKVFIRIALPASMPAIIASLIFGFVWYWNETYLAGMLYGKNIQTLPIKLEQFVNRYSKMFPVSDGNTKNRLNEGIRMAGTFITIAPLILMYLGLQKQFVESIDTVGITGE